MADLQEFFWRMHSAHIASAQHYETQRSTVTSLILVLATALVGLITFDDKVESGDSPAALFLFFLGLFGALFAFKHHERFRLHVERAKEYRDALDKELGGAPLKAVKDAADARHNKSYAAWRLINASVWWVLLNLIVAMLGGYLMFKAAS